jgi:hypothetical protein
MFTGRTERTIRPLRTEAAGNGRLHHGKTRSVQMFQGSRESSYASLMFIKISVSCFIKN